MSLNWRQYLPFNGPMPHGHETIPVSVPDDQGRRWVEVPAADFISNYGGGGGAGAPTVKGPFTIAFNTPNLAAGVPFYTPTPGDILLDAWVDIETAWDGTTPSLDIGSFASVTTGLWKEAGHIVNMATAGRSASGTGIRTINSDGQAVPSLMGFDFNPVYATGHSTVPALFTAANPLKVVVSQTGAAGGADPGSTQGLAHVYLSVVTPAAF